MKKNKSIRNTRGGRAGEWILTDGDSFQIRRRIPGVGETCEDVFELYQITQTNTGWSDEEQRYGVSHAIVFLDKVIPEQVLDCYGYESLEQFKTEYADEWKGVFAECVFETSALEYMLQPVDSSFTWNEAKGLICTLSGYQEKDGLTPSDPIMRFMAEHRVLRIGSYDLRLSDAGTVVMTDTSTGHVWTFASKEELDELITSESLPLADAMDMVLR